MAELDDDDLDPADDPAADVSGFAGPETADLDAETAKLAVFVAGAEPTVEEINSLSDAEFEAFLAGRDARRPELIERSREPVESELDPFVDDRPIAFGSLSEDQFAQFIEVREKGKADGLSDAQIEERYKMVLVGKFEADNGY